MSFTPHTTNRYQSSSFYCLQLQKHQEKAQKVFSLFSTCRPRLTSSLPLFYFTLNCYYFRTSQLQMPWVAKKSSHIQSLLIVHDSAAVHVVGITTNPKQKQQNCKERLIFSFQYTESQRTVNIVVK